MSKSPSAAGVAFHETGDELPPLPDAPTGGTHAAGEEELYFDAMTPGALDARQYHDHPVVEPTVTGESRAHSEISLPPELDAFARLLAQETARHLNPYDAAHPPESTREAAARRAITGSVTLAAGGSAGAGLQLIGADAQRRVIFVSASAACIVAATMAEAQAGTGFLLPASLPLPLDTVAELWVAPTSAAAAGTVVSYCSLTEALTRASDVGGVR